MLYGASVFPPVGLSLPGIPSGLPGLPQAAEQQVDRIEKRIEAGKLDTAALEQRLAERFGEDAVGIIGEDGRIDFDRLEKLIVETRSTQLQELLISRFGEAAAGAVGSDGSVDREQLTELFAQRRIEQILGRLEERLGADVPSVVNEDGAIDFEALKALLEDRTTAETKAADETSTGPVSETAGADEASDTQTVDAVAVSTQTEEVADEAATGDETTDVASEVSAVEQLAQLRQVLLQDRLEDRFGDAADAVFGEDGRIDFEMLRALFQDRGPVGFGGPGRGHGAYSATLLRPPPLFDVRG